MEKTIEKLKDDKHYYGAFGKKFLSNSDIFNLIHNPQDFQKEQEPLYFLVINLYQMIFLPMKI